MQHIVTLHKCTRTTRCTRTSWTVVHLCCKVTIYCICVSILPRCTRASWTISLLTPAALCCIKQAHICIQSTWRSRFLRSRTAYMASRARSGLPAHCHVSCVSSSSPYIQTYLLFRSQFIYCQVYPPPHRMQVSGLPAQCHMWQRHGLPVMEYLVPKKKRP